MRTKSSDPMMEPPCPVRLDDQLKALGIMRSPKTLPPVERSGLIWMAGRGYVKKHVAPSYVELRGPVRPIPQGHDFDVV